MSDLPPDQVPSAGDLEALLTRWRALVTTRDRAEQVLVPVSDLVTVMAVLDTQVRCSCGFGGQHDPDNPRCVVNDPTQAWLTAHNNAHP